MSEVPRRQGGRVVGERAAARGAGRRGRRVALAAVPLGVVVSGALVYQASFSAFTASTANPGNTFGSGSVVLSDSQSGTALFSTASNGKLVPGSTQQGCISVSYTGDVAAQVRLTAAYEVDGGSNPINGLGPYLNFTVEQVATSGTCSAASSTGDGTLFATAALDGFATGHTTFASGFGTWAPTGAATDTRRYRLTYALQDTDAAQGKQAAVRLTWRAQSS